MKGREKLLALSGFLLIIAALSYVAVLHNRRIGSESTGALPDQQYVNTIYGFSFSYPPQYSLNELTSRQVELQDEASGQGLVELSIEVADGTSSKTFDDFALFRTELTCDADGTAGSARCPTLSRSEPFTGTGGSHGKVFYLDYRLMSGGATTTGEAGPFYVFNISANVPEKPFAALLVYPAHSTGESPLYDVGAGVALNIANSLRLTGAGQ